MATYDGEAATIGTAHIGDLAHRFAKEVYDTSTNCLMAHSIRAVQEFLIKHQKGRHWISIEMSQSKKYLGKRAIAVIRPNDTDILVADGIGLENQRRGIAHELGHLLFVKLENRMKTCRI